MLPLIIQFMQKYWKQIAIAAITAIIFLFGYYRGYSHEKAAFDAFKLQMEVNAKVQQQHNASVIKQQQVITENITKGYSNAINKVNAYYANHPNIKWMSSSTAGNSMPAAGEAASRIDDSAQKFAIDTTGIAPDITPQDCAADSLRFYYLQQWVTQQLQAQ